MKFKEFITKSLLLEGGKAISSSEKVTQEEAKHIIPLVIDLISKKLQIQKDKISVVGSAGNKPNLTDLSGDIDIAIETTQEKLSNKLKDLAFDNKTFKQMKGINLFSFGFKYNDKIIQIDLLPVENINYAKWSMYSDKNDLKAGLKSAHRNELLFAVAKFALPKILKTDELGNPIEIERYFYDLTKGLLFGKQSKISKSGKINKNFTTIEKQLKTNNPDEIAQLLFGKNVKAKDLNSFYSILKIINSPSFPFAKDKSKILDMTKTGIINKKLIIPEELK